MALRVPGDRRNMKLLHIALIVPLSSLAFGAAVLRAEAIRLADGSVLEGTLGAPASVIVKTADGEQRVSFNLLAPELQKLYWPKTDGAGAAQTLNGVVTDEELDALANEVSLETWTQVAAIGSFRDKPERRGAGGLVVAKAFNAIEENWVSIYSPKDTVGAAGNWNTEVARAKVLLARAPQFMQKRWLELFIRAGDAVARRDSNEFAAALKELKRSSVAGQPGTANGKNFFTAK